jgi:hypothetical protein
VTVTTDEGCTLTQNFSITTEFDNPATPVITVENDTILHAPAGYSTYQWLLNGGEITGATLADFTAMESGEYSVVVTNEGGCEATSAPVVVSITHTRELLPGFSLLSLTPNPFEDTLLLKWQTSSAQHFEVKISDSSGKQRFLKVVEMTSTGERTFDVSGLPAGVYFFTLSGGGNTWSQKVIK